MKLTKEQAEALYEKGHISEKSFAALGGRIQKFAEGGKVENMSVPSEAQVADLTRPPTGLEYLQNVASTQVSSQPEAPKADTIGLSGRMAKAKEMLGGEQPATEAPTSNAKLAAADAGPQAGAAPGSLTTDQPRPLDPMAGMSQMYGNMGKSYDQAFGLEAAGAKVARDAGVGLANAQSAYIGKMADESQKFQQVQQTKEAERQAQLANAQKDVDTLSQKYNGPEAKLNPDRVFSNMSTGQKIRSFIGFVLAGKAAPEMYNNIVNRDLDAQKNDVANIGRQLSVKENLLGQMRARFGDERQAETAARMVMLDNFKMRLDQEAMKYKAPEVQANYMQATAHIMKERAGLQAQFGQMAMARMPLYTAGDQMRDILMKVPEKMQDTAVKELGEYQKHEQVKDTVKEALQKMYDTRNSVGIPGTSIGAGGYADYEAARTTIKTLTSEMFGGKSEQEFKLIEGLLPKKGDTQKTQAYKMQKVMQKLDSQAAFPLLDQYGISKRHLDLKRN